MFGEDAAIDDCALRYTLEAVTADGEVRPCAAGRRGPDAAAWPARGRGTVALADGGQADGPPRDASAAPASRPCPVAAAAWPWAAASPSCRCTAWKTSPRAWRCAPPVLRCWRKPSSPAASMPADLRNQRQRRHPAQPRHGERAMNVLITETLRINLDSEQGSAAAAAMCTAARATTTSAACWCTTAIRARSTSRCWIRACTPAPIRPIPTGAASQYYCPDCGTLVEAEYLPPGHPPLHDIELDIDAPQGAVEGPPRDGNPRRRPTRLLSASLQRALHAAAHHPRHLGAPADAGSAPSTPDTPPPLTRPRSHR